MTRSLLLLTGRRTVGLLMLAVQQHQENLYFCSFRFPLRQLVLARRVCVPAARYLTFNNWLIADASLLRAH